MDKLFADVVGLFVAMFLKFVSAFFMVWLWLWVIEYFDLVNFIAESVTIISEV